MFLFLLVLLLRKNALKEAIPKYLYHFTSLENFEKIKKDGKLKISKDIIDGVFFVEEKDFKQN